ncbi:hypothetical protein L083_7840 [Actinoplanes sp. N902-109]|nr:hypothetical protein L083_7840 [Actinoplanes sp. N902-109]
MTLYALAVLLLAAGAVWFVRSAPTPGEDQRVAAGRTTVERLLPDLAQQTGAETLVLKARARVERNTGVPTGSYALMLICAGSGQVRLRLSATLVDSGRAVPCGAEPQPVVLDVSLGSMLFLAISSEAGEEVVVRWRLVPSPAS